MGLSSYRSRRLAGTRAEGILKPHTSKTGGPTCGVFFKRLQTSTFGGTDPHDEVYPATEAAAEQGYEEDDAHQGGVEVEIFGQTAANARYLAVFSTTEEFLGLVFHYFSGFGYYIIEGAGTDCIPPLGGSL